MSNFSITTAISYTNGPPHIGHVYEAILADFLARYQRNCGKNVWFLTGTDEHGQKIADKAKELGLEPKELCDQNSTLFKNILEKFNIVPNRFIRTTDPDHKRKVDFLFQTMQVYGDIYLSQYIGWYNKREESFLTETQAKLTDYCDPVTQIEYQKVSEPSYFFRLRKYKDSIVHVIKSGIVQIEPESLGKNILARLLDEENPLEDVSISRITVKWGLPVPLDPEHTLYVWFDALINYLTGIPREQWPPEVQIIGKDISWFHCIIWIAMLMSSRLPLPKKIYAHGFVNDHEGNKMSKSLGNVVSPNDLLDKFPPDTIRYLFLRNSSQGQDTNLSVEQMTTVHNSELLAKVGNYIARVFSLTAKYNNQVVPILVSQKPDPVFDLVELKDQCQLFASNFEFNKYTRVVIEHFEIMNCYINTTAIYKKETELMTRMTVIRNLVEGLYILTHFLEPICPTVSARIFELITVPKTTIDKLEWGIPSLNGAVFTESKPLIYTKL